MLWPETKWWSIFFLEFFLLKTMKINHDRGTILMLHGFLSIEVCLHSLHNYYTTFSQDFDKIDWKYLVSSLKPYKVYLIRSPKSLEFASKYYVLTALFLLWRHSSWLKNGPTMFNKIKELSTFYINISLLAEIWDFQGLKLCFCLKFPTQDKIRMKKCCRTR